MAGTAEYFGLRGTASALAARIVVAVACAGMFGAAAALGSGGATASIGATAAGAKAASFADRFAAFSARPDCAGGTWPYFEPGCLRRRDGSALRPVRVIAIDRQISGR
jgi:hypothetical protein